MKMAKASEADIDMAMKLANVLDDIERGYFPEKFIDLDGDPHDIEIPELIDTTDAEQYERLIDGLRNLLKQGSVFRVIWGMAVVCDPKNECIDPDDDCIAHHPKRQQMENALLWTLYHHQGGSSHIGQPIRKLLGIGQHERMTDEQIESAKAFGQPGIDCAAPPETAENQGQFSTVSAVSTEEYTTAQAELNQSANACLAKEGGAA